MWPSAPAFSPEASALGRETPEYKPSTDSVLYGLHPSLVALPHWQLLQRVSVGRPLPAE